MQRSRDVYEHAVVTDLRKSRVKLAVRSTWWTSCCSCCLDPSPAALILGGRAPSAPSLSSGERLDAAARLAVLGQAGAWLARAAVVALAEVSPAFVVAAAVRAHVPWLGNVVTRLR